VQDRIRLRPLTIDDFHNVLNWSRDSVFCAANGWESNRSEDEIFRWWLSCVNNTAKDFLRLGIEFEDRLVGYVDLACIHDHSAELGIAIGDSSIWGRGIGTKVALSMIEYGTIHFGITLYTAETDKENHRAQRMLTKIGFNKINEVGSTLRYQLTVKGETQ